MQILEMIIPRILESDAWRRFSKHWMAYFTLRLFGWPKFPKSKYFEIKQIAKQTKGYGLLAFVSVDKFILNYKLNHFLMGCKWGHAGLIRFGEDGELVVRQMINSGLDDSYLLDLFGEIDGFALLWVPLKNKESAEEAERRIRLIDSVKDKVTYDYSLKLEKKLLEWVNSKDKLDSVKLDSVSLKMYCSEYAYVIVNGLTNNEMQAKEFMGRLIFEPDDFYKSCQILFEYY